MKQTINKRIFLVGCARSGTTLLQSMLGAHTQIATFPESHFFQRAVPGREWARRLGLASRAAKMQLDLFLNEAGYPEIQTESFLMSLSLRRITGIFINILDQLTLKEGKSIWLEKTPGHLYHIDTIQRLVPNTKFIHLIRDGQDVVASMYSITRANKGAWGKPMEIDECIHWWEEAINLSEPYLNQPDHFFVRYEQLMENPHSILGSLCSFLNIPYQEAMLTGYPEVARKVVLKNEPWKTNTMKPLQKSNNFVEIFSQEQKDYINKRLKPMEDKIADWVQPSPFDFMAESMR